MRGVGAICLRQSLNGAWLRRIVLDSEKVSNKVGLKSPPEKCEGQKNYIIFQIHSFRFRVGFRGVHECMYLCMHLYHIFFRGLSTDPFFL